VPLSTTIGSPPPQWPATVRHWALNRKEFAPIKVSVLA
jgi:hypothetical protein